MKTTTCCSALALVLFAVPAAADPPTTADSPDEPTFDEAACWHTPPATSHGHPGAQSAIGEEEHYRPQLRYAMDPQCMRVWFPVSTAVTGGIASPYPVDRDVTELDPGATVSPRVRIGAAFNSGKSWVPFVFHAEYEHDVVAGVAGTESTPEGDGYATQEGFEHRLRKGFVRASLGYYAHLSIGWQTSHWGLGLLANDGAHGWTPNNAYFSDPRGGDTPLRLSLATGPHTPAGLVVAVSGDMLNGDFLADDDVLLEGDEALQVAGVVSLGTGLPHGGGAYVARRHQEAADGSATDVWVFDVTARTRFDFETLSFGFEAEGAFVTGETELAPNTTFPKHDVRAGGATARAFLDIGGIGSVIDVLYASGDPNFDDDVSNGFKADPNHEFGLLLFRHVLSAHSARTMFRAGDPSLVGVPSEDLDRVPTRGSATNTVGLFPRLRGRPLPGLEIYGGPLFAWSAAPSLDAFNTRIAGGSSRNSLDGAAGRYLGTEFDLGARYRLNLAGSELTIGAEGGAFKPGSAFRMPDGTLMDAVYGGRLMLDAKL